MTEYHDDPTQTGAQEGGDDNEAEQEEVPTAEAFDFDRVKPQADPLVLFGIAGQNAPVTATRVAATTSDDLVQAFGAASPLEKLSLLSRLPQSGFRHIARRLDVGAPGLNPNEPTNQADVFVDALTRIFDEPDRLGATTVMNARIVAPGESPFGEPLDTPRAVLSALAAAAPGSLIYHLDNGIALAVGRVLRGRAVPFMPMEAGSLVSIEPDKDERVTVFTRRAHIVVDPSVDAGRITALKERMAVLSDPRAWELATGGDPANRRAGWMQSIPTSSDHEPASTDAQASIVTANLGQTWDAASTARQDFYELVWPGFNRPWGIMLKVNYRVLDDNNAATNETDWSKLQVDYGIGRHIDAPGGPFGRRPIGPSLMPVTCDDGHLIIEEVPGGGPGGTLLFRTEMVKALNFADIVPNTVFDAVEEAMPFRAEEWFNRVDAAWFEKILDETLDLSALRIAATQKTFTPPYDPNVPAYLR